MDILLIFFAIPFVVIVISIALQKILKSPILVAAIIFSIVLLIAIILSNTTLLVASVFYGILSFIVAFIVCILCRIIRNTNPCRNTLNIAATLNPDSTQTISSESENEAANANTNVINDNSSGTFCGCYRRRDR